MAQFRGVSRVLAKLKKSVEEGKYYEAHQMYRTLYFRYLTQEKYKELLDMLFEGSILLLNHSQQTSGVDLALLMLDVLEKSHAQPTEHNINRIIELFRLLCCPERQQYLFRAVKWSTTADCKLGHPTLHQQLAQVLWKEKQYALARYHYLRSDDSSGCATLLIELHLLKGYPSEVDLFLAQAVLQYLCLQKKVQASKLFEAYTASHPDITGTPPGPPYLLPLLNFLWFLLLAVEKGKVAEFTVLCEQYQPSLQRDPCYRQYLDRIGQLFFALPPPPEHHGSLFGNLLRGLLEGLDDDSDDEDNNASSSRSAGQLAQPLAHEDLD
uniref:Golgi to ER traffic protein 4 homolog n=1 Tax=Hirondellea gigas TaxID=1518452 RepID=A0A2P2I207_9CRUS